ncbi:MAG: NAD(+) synthase [Bacteroidales bacterium]|jgi:NAD+ synthetase|nr:NAD(+) synthase [Bacteroidales bacterium]
MSEVFSLLDTQMLKTEKEIAYAVKVMQSKVSAYILDNQLKSLVVGVSGGIDSAFAVALLRPVCDFSNATLIGRSITIATNTADEIERSKLVGSAFCHDFQHIDYTPVFEQFKEYLPQLEDNKLTKLRLGNCKARMRMIALYDLAQFHKGMVISTDNFTEYLTGFWTLHGDVGDFAPFMHLWKTEVYEAARYLCKSLTKEQSDILQLCIDAVPTDGLGISSSDLEQLGLPTYEEVDLVLSAFLKGDNSYQNHPVVERFLATRYKRNNTVNISRLDLIAKE